VSEWSACPSSRNPSVRQCRPGNAGQSGWTWHLVRDSPGRTEKEKGAELTLDRSAAEV